MGFAVTITLFIFIAVQLWGIERNLTKIVRHLEARQKALLDGITEEQMRQK